MRRQSDISKYTMLNGTDHGRRRQLSKQLLVEVLPQASSCRVNTPCPSPHSMIFNSSSAYYFQDELQALTLMPRPYKRAMQIEILKPEYASRLVTIVVVLASAGVYLQRGRLAVHTQPCPHFPQQCMALPFSLRCVL